jgi:uroporphyrinogen-III synthase
MFEINDATDPTPIEAWIRRCIAKPFDDVVLLTGEGLRRLAKVARRLGVESDFVAALANAQKFTRGPKPGRALREIGLAQQHTTEKPTSEGVIDMLARMDLKAHRVGLQLYPDKDHSTLIGAIKAQGAEVDAVLPYVYDPKAADANIALAIEEMAARKVDAVALTNLGQVRRLIETARAHGWQDKLLDGLKHTAIASVGPAVSDELKSHGLCPDITPPDGAYFMRPLVSAIAAGLAKRPPRAETMDK